METEQEIREQRQLNDLYIPLLVMQQRGKAMFNVLTSLLGRPYVFVYGTQLSTDDMLLWKTWTSKAFLPMNAEIAGLLENKKDLFDDEMPQSFRRFLSYNEAYKAEFERWEKEGGDYRHPGNFPGDFEEDVLREIRRLAMGGWLRKL
jgi:hypothetical protein